MTFYCQRNTDPANTQKLASSIDAADNNVVTSPVTIQLTGTDKPKMAGLPSSVSKQELNVSQAGVVMISADLNWTQSSCLNKRISKLL